MNLHGLVSPFVSAVNPSLFGYVMVSTGYTSVKGKRTPTYNITRNVLMQVQALSESDVRKIEAMNIAESTHTIYMNGRIDGLVRVENKGGDLIGVDNRVWAVTGVMEQWPDWTRVSVVLQPDSYSVPPP